MLFKEIIPVYTEKRMKLINTSIKCRVKKLKLSHYTPWRRLGERLYSSYSFMTSALDEVSGQRHAQNAGLLTVKVDGTYSYHSALKG
jgi:hypothetical protein